jgi:hypothetical protein
LRLGFNGMRHWRRRGGLGRERGALSLLPLLLMAGCALVFAVKSLTGILSRLGVTLNKLNDEKSSLYCSDLTLSEAEPNCIPRRLDYRLHYPDSSFAVFCLFAQFHRENFEGNAAIDNISEYENCGS